MKFNMEQKRELQITDGKTTTSKDIKEGKEEPEERSTNNGDENEINMEEQQQQKGTERNGESDKKALISEKGKENNKEEQDEEKNNEEKMEGNKNKNKKEDKKEKGKEDDKRKNEKEEEIQINKLRKEVDVLKNIIKERDRIKENRLKKIIEEMKTAEIVAIELISEEKEKQVTQANKKIGTLENKLKKKDEELIQCKVGN